MAYQIVPQGPNSKKYFMGKYATENPEIKIEGSDIEIFGCHWGDANRNFAALIYAMRSGLDGYSLAGAFYGHIGVIGELVSADEIEIVPPSDPDHMMEVV
jgi:hypothetical protein